MQNSLPIQIFADSEMFKTINNALTTINKLEAWLNFETLTANWYGNETTNIKCLIFIINEENFELKKTGNPLDNLSIQKDKLFMFGHDNNKKTFKALCTITSKQLNALSKNSSQFELHIKTLLHSIINEIAVQANLTSI